MSSAEPQRGGAPLGYLTELPAIEAGAILYLRLWAEGDESRTRIRQDFEATLGRDGGASVYEAFDTLCNLSLRHARRLLMRHSVNCKCFSGDESCFANFVGAAGEGAREDALMIAMAFVRLDFAPLLIGLAQEFAMALRTMAARAQTLRTGMPPAQTIH